MDEKVQDFQSQGPYDGRTVANYILDLGDEYGSVITQLKLLKMVYFVHGWYLASEGRPLIKQYFEAWEYGPVVRVIREAFKQFGKSPITTRAKKLDIFEDRLVNLPKIGNNYDRTFIKNVFEGYHRYDGWKLSDITHESGSPWDRIWNSRVPIGRLSLRLEEKDIKDHFSKLPNRFALH